MSRCPAVTVVLPTHNRAHSVVAAIHSVLWQTFDDLELIVVDDGSTDGSDQVLGALEDPRLRVLRHASARGAPAARNTGIAAARAPWVAFQDSDDIWLPHKLERQMASVRRHGAAAVAWCGMLRVLPAGAQYQPAAKNVRGDGAMLPALLWGPVIGTQTLLARRDALEAVGGFDEDLESCQDWELALRLARDHRFAFEKDVLVIAPKGDDGISVNMARRLRGRERVFEKHRALFAAHPEIEAANLYDLGYLAMVTGEVSRARRYFTQALRLRPRRMKYAAAWASARAGTRVFQGVHDAVGRMAELGRTAIARAG